MSRTSSRVRMRRWHLLAPAAVVSCILAGSRFEDVADAGAVNGFGLGAAPASTAPPTWTPCPGNPCGAENGGQSLAAGNNSTPIDGGLGPFGSVEVYDDAGYVDGAWLDANSPTVAVIPARSPERVELSEGYPANLAGETHDHCFNYELHTLAGDTNPFDAGDAGWAYPPLALTEVPQGGTALAGLSDASVSWNGASFEATKLHNVYAHYVMGIGLMLHGEADSSNQNLAYGTDLQTFVAHKQALYASITGQTYQQRWIETIQSSEPGAGYGDLTTANIANGQISAAVNSAQIVLAGPKYQYDAYYVGGVHMNATGYCQVGELEARAEWVSEHGTKFAPVWPTSFSRSGATVTITYNVPLPATALAFDGTSGANTHCGGTGYFSAWCNADGFEAIDQQLPGYATNLTNDGSGEFEWTWSQATGLSSGTVLTMWNVYSVPTANGSCTVNVIDSTHFSCTGSTYASGWGGVATVLATGFAIIGINSVSVSGNQVTVNLARSPVGSSLQMSYGYYTDLAFGSTNYTGGWQGGEGRGGALRGNAYALTGAWTGIQQYDWAINFGHQSVP